MFLEECKYIIEEKKMRRYISVDLEISSDDSGKEYIKTTEIHIFQERTHVHTSLSTCIKSSYQKI